MPAAFDTANVTPIDPPKTAETAQASATPAEEVDAIEPLQLDARVVNNDERSPIG